MQSYNEKNKLVGSTPLDIHNQAELAKAIASAERQGAVKHVIGKLPVKDEVLQLSPEEARDFAANLLQAAEAAEQDAFIFEFNAQLLESDEMGARMLHQFRAWRNEHGQNR